MADPTRPLALVTGASRARGIGAAVAIRLAETGWDIGRTTWPAYDDRMPWGSDDETALDAAITAAGGRAYAVHADLAESAVPDQIVSDVSAAFGRPVTALVMSHCESVDSTIEDTTVESFDRHYAVNVRASWLLIRAFARQLPRPCPTGRIIALTSDHTAGNVPYGATKGALDRVVLAAADELADLRITANVVNPGATDTGWMDDELMTAIAARNPLGRVGLPRDAANLVAFLCSSEGGWVNRQLLHSDGGA